MSHFMTALAMKQKGLKPSTKIVLYWIAEHHNGESGDCFPSHKRLAELSELTDRDVRRQISKLVDVGLIQIESRTRPNGSQTSNNYILCLHEDDGRTNSPAPMDKLSSPPVSNCPTLNLGINNLVNEPNILIERFDEFYAAYPIKKGKGAAKKAWEKAVKKADPDHIISNAALYASSVQNKDPKFIAHPATWLNAERWDDDISKEVLQAAIDPQNMMLDVLKSMGLKYNA